MMTPWPFVLWLDTPRGPGRVIACVDRGPDADLEWVVVNDEGELWSALNYDVRVVRNVTYGVRLKPAKSMMDKLHELADENH